VTTWKRKIIFTVSKSLNSVTKTFSGTLLAVIALQKVIAIIVEEKTLLFVRSVCIRKLMYKR
jgi:hypothetical protein